MNAKPPLPDHAMLRKCADLAFELGLIDGQCRSRPVTSHELRLKLEQTLPEFGYFDWRVAHREKMRQVYGAAFDIIKLLRK